MKFMKCIFFMKFHEISRDKKGPPNGMHALAVTPFNFVFLFFLIFFFSFLRMKQAAHVGSTHIHTYWYL
jgi:hypothetical protein